MCVCRTIIWFFLWRHLFTENINTIWSAKYDYLDWASTASCDVCNFTQVISTIRYLKRVLVEMGSEDSNFNWHIASVFGSGIRYSFPIELCVTVWYHQRILIQYNFPFKFRIKVSDLKTSYLFIILHKFQCKTYKRFMSDALFVRFHSDIIRNKQSKITAQKIIFTANITSGPYWMSLSVD